MRSSILFIALLLLACNRHHTPTPPASASPPAAPPPASAAPKAAQAAGLTVAGKVLERIDAGTYSYLRLGTQGGEQWAAVPRCTLKNGDDAVVTNAMSMDGFESKTLKRKFEHIVFGVLQGQGAPAAAAPAAMGQMTPPAPKTDPHAGAKMPAAHSTNLAPIAVSRATGPNAATVAELYAKKAALKDKQVRVHGKVVKVLSGIMGKNWLHVRDGSGSNEKKDNDLTVTTNDVVAMGSLVLVQGVLHNDIDFGSGYSYSVIVEDAKVTKD